MQIVFHSHHATVSDRMRARVVKGLEKVAQRMPGIVEARIRFDQDGPTRVVELVLHAPGKRHLIARSDSRYWGPAIAAALDQLEHQVGTAKRTRKEQGRYGVAERRAFGG